MTLWLPPREANRLQGERQRYVAGLLQQRELHAEVERWNGILKEIDPALELVRAPENATHAALKPGYWHVIRHDSGEMPPGVVVHEGPNGEYLDPDSSLLERLRAGDMWSNRSMKEIAARVGYTHASQFTREFRLACGLAPRIFRHRHAFTSQSAQ